MNGIRKLIVFALTALLVALIPVTSMAGPTKKWSVASSAITGFGPTTLTLTIRNETPNGNSNINSLVVNFPSGIQIDTSQANPVTSAWVGQLSYTTGSGGNIKIIMLL